MSKVLQAKLKAQEASDGQFKFSTLQMGMPVPYRIYSEISQEEIVRAGEGWCKRNHPYTVQVQERRDCSGSSLCRSCTSVRKHPAKLSVSDFVGYLKGKSALMNLRQASRNVKQVGQKFLGTRVLCVDGRKCGWRNRERIHKASDRRIHERRQKNL